MILETMVRLLNENRLPTENKNVLELPNYYSVHNVAEAQQISKGKGIKVGILDTSFYEENIEGIITSYQKFGNNFCRGRGHGYYMAAVLKEIAPEVEIYALDIDYSNKFENMKKAINWAIANGLDILTHSGAVIRNKEERANLNRLADLANENGVITTFIHCDSINNFWPHAFSRMISGDYQNMQRSHDFDMLGYDYTWLPLEKHNRFNMVYRSRGNIESGNDMVFYSESSTSPVLAGFMAILKSINGKANIQEYKEILQRTSYCYDFEGFMSWESGSYHKTIDIGKAAKEILETQ